MIQSNKLSEILKNSQKRSLANLMRGNSSCFQFTYSNSGAWILPKDNSPEMDRPYFDAQKCIVTIIWEIKSIYVIDFLSEGQSLNCEYYINNLLISVFEKMKSIWSE